jgi:hypothetical protein
MPRERAGVRYMVIMKIMILWASLFAMAPLVRAEVVVVGHERNVVVVHHQYHHYYHHYYHRHNVVIVEHN